VTLPDSDVQYLTSRNLTHEVAVETGMICVLLPKWNLPSGYNHTTADLLLRLQPGYPDLPPDMWWFEPSLQLADGRGIQATEVIELHLGRSWQRWSRHLDAGQWRSGIDGLENYLALVNQELERCVLEPVR
jgi:hypothetical protein